MWGGEERKQKRVKKERKILLFNKGEKKSLKIERCYIVLVTLEIHITLSR